MLVSYRNGDAWGALLKGSGQVDGRHDGTREGLGAMAEVHGLRSHSLMGAEAGLQRGGISRRSSGRRTGHPLVRTRGPTVVDYPPHRAHKRRQEEDKEGAECLWRV